MKEEKIRLDNIKQGIEGIEKRMFKRVDFDVEIEGVGTYEAKMYKVTDNLIRIDLVKVKGK